MEAVLDEGRETKDEGRIEEALTLFVEAVELSADLEIVGTACLERGRETRGEEVFVIRDHSKAEGIEGAYVEVSIVEVIKVVGAQGENPKSEIRNPKSKAQEFISVIRNDRKPIVLEGVTRIVGYYSRVNNWNKSKVGELRDRTQRNYGLGSESPRFDTERTNVIDSL